MKTKFYLFVLLSAMILGTGCQTAEKLLDEGRYDELLSLAQRKMSGKKEKKARYVLLAEDAFARITTRDMDRIEQLKLSNRSEDWQTILHIAEKIARRQDRLLPFLPLISENGYQATFTFVKTTDIIQYAEARVVEKLYDEGMSFLRAGRNGDKLAARAAYGKFEDVLRYHSDYRETSTMHAEAQTLGITRVLLTVDNKARIFMPEYVAAVLEEHSSANNAFWKQYYTRIPEGAEVDYIARLVVHAIEVGPDAIGEERINRHKRIQDGWDYVLDANGNVAKDSLGNDVKVPRYFEAHAVILKTHQEKAAFLRGRIEIDDARNTETVETRPIHVEKRFYHQAQTFFGDERALDKGDRIHIGLLPFPSDEAMMLELATLSHPAFENALAKSRYL